MGAYWIFQVEINPVKFTQGIRWISTIPTSTAQKTHLCRQSVTVSEDKSTHEAEFCTLMWEREHKCIWQFYNTWAELVTVIKNCADEAKKDHRLWWPVTTGITVHNSHHHNRNFMAFIVNEEENYLRLLQWRSAKRITEQSLEDLSLLIFRLKLRWNLKERRIHGVGDFRIFLLQNYALFCQSTCIFSIDWLIFFFFFLRAVG